MGFPQELQHLIVVTLENRSFDHVLGALSADAIWTAAHPGEEVDDVGAGFENADAAGTIHRTGAFPAAHPRKYVWKPDAPHGGDMVTMQLETPRPNVPGSTMGGFVQAYTEAYVRQHKSPPANPGDIMMHYTRADLPISYHFADHFAVCDRWFAPVAGDTFPNRMYAIAGDCDGIETTDFNKKFLIGAKLTTVFEQMQRFGASWAMYSGVLPMGLALPRVRSLCNYSHGSPTGHSRWLAQFAIDAENDQLPRLCWLEPTYYWHASGLSKHLETDPIFRDPCCDHPPSDITRGQELLRWIYNVVRSFPNIWAKSALVITYDEHGGFFDHVSPPDIHPEVERNRRLDGSFTDHFTRRGPRVPAFVIAPWIKSRVLHERFDHCSILKFLCEWCGIPPWTERIASPRISSLAVAFQATVQVAVAPAPPDVPEPLAVPTPAAEGVEVAPAEPDVGDWLPEIDEQMQKEAKQAERIAPIIEPLAIAGAESAFATVGVEGFVHTMHIEASNVDARKTSILDEGDVVESDTVVDGRRVVSILRRDETRVLIWGPP